MADPTMVGDLSVSPEHALSDEEITRQAIIAARNELERPRPRRTPGEGWFSPLSPYEKAAQAAFLGLGALDWGQTIRFTQDKEWQARNPGWRERNPVLGSHPSRARVNALIPLGLAAHTLGAWALPRPWRNVLQVAGIAGEANATYGNHQQGIYPQWPWK